MCPLVRPRAALPAGALVLTLILLSLSSPSEALIQKITSEVSVKSSLDHVTLQEDVLEKKAQRKILSLQGELDEVARYGLLVANFRREYPDYSSTVLRDRSGKEYLLEPVARHSPEDFLTLSADRKSTRLNSSHIQKSRMPSSA